MVAVTKSKCKDLSRTLGVFSAGFLMVFAFSSSSQSHSASFPSLSHDSSVFIDVSTAANEDIGALNFVKDTAEDGLTFLSNPNSSVEQKKREFKKLLNNSFDLDTIARFSLGKFWNSASSSQQKEYSDLFKKMVVEVYANRFGDYKGQKFEVRSVRSIGKRDSMVTSYIMPERGDDIQVDWRVRKNGSSYKVVDVYVAGVSMSVTQRSDFASVIQRGGGDVAVLIDYLKTKF